MSDRIERLVYCSKNRIGGDTAQIAREIDSILTAARHNNPRCGITGALIFNRGLFAQLLEGECAAVEALFERIQRDPRHGDLQVLSLRRVPARLFPHWSMAYLGRSRADQDLFGHTVRDTGFTTSPVEGERLLKIIHAIALEEEANAA